MDGKISVSQQEFSALRGEILESQKIRNDFLKYKFFAVAVLASAGLGLGSGGQGPQYIDYILCLIPLVCLYVDIICYHNNCRIRVIVQFLKYSHESYERYLEILGQATNHIRGKPSGPGVHYYYQLEDWAIAGASVALSSLLIVYAGLTGALFSDRFGIFLLFSLLGVVCTYAAHRLYTARIATLRDAQQHIAPP